ncbi:MAG TPA: MraY family glycosyltransferase [Bryobacteraceae bacterium]|nr:MraY family glycosyltransferase [Bryobacteraceae bacterium]
MKELFWLGLRAFLICLVLTPIFRDIFRSYGIVDQPDRRRKVHAHPIPRVGGIPIFIAYALALYPYPHTPTALADYLPLIRKLAPAATLIFATGLIDDLLGLKPWQKLAGQLAAASLAYWAGVRVLGVGGYGTGAWWSLPLTLLWLIACTNAFNLVDGLDGLAAGVGLVATLTLLFAALIHGNPALASASVPMVGALLGFLCYNFNPATVFLGDSGALLIGFLLGCFGAVWTQKSDALISLTVPLLALSIPLIDVSLAILRRFLRNQPIFTADRGHIHHRLIDQGLTPRRAVLVLYLLCAMAAAFALLLTMPRAGRYFGFVMLAVCLVVWFGIRQLRYAEFGLASRLLFGGELQRTLGGQLRLERLAEEVADADDEEQCWRLISAAARDFGFDSIRLSLRGCLREAGSLSGRTGSRLECWSLRVPVGAEDYFELTRRFESGVLPMMVAPFLDTLRRALESRLEDWNQHTASHS